MRKLRSCVQFRKTLHIEIFNIIVSNIGTYIGFDYIYYKYVCLTILFKNIIPNII